MNFDPYFANPYKRHYVFFPVTPSTTTAPCTNRSLPRLNLREGKVSGRILGAVWPEAVPVLGPALEPVPSYERLPRRPDVFLGRGVTPLTGAGPEGPPPQGVLHPGGRLGHPTDTRKADTAQEKRPGRRHTHRKSLPFHSVKILWLVI